MNSRNIIIRPGILLFIALLLLATVSSSENENQQVVCLVADSLDYADSLAWGFLDDDIDDTEQQITSTDDWMKAWIRVYAQPAIRQATVSLNSMEDDMNPLAYSHLRFENVRISNSGELGIIPKPYLVYAANPTAFQDEQEEADGDWWYLEVLIEKRGRTENEIARDVQCANVLCDAYIQRDNEYEKTVDVPIDMSAVKRMIFFDDGAVNVYVDYWEKCDISVDEIFVNYPVDEFLELEVRNHPDHFQCYSLQLTIDNQSSYDVCDLDKCSIISDNQAWLMYYELEFNHLYCRSGETERTDAYYLIMRKSEYGGTISEEEIEHLTVPIVAHTEFAGILWLGESEGTMGFTGIPFAIESRWTKESSK